ncbi:hypothetical protein DPMN_122720 [Dreissena polymorpha]|uniref:Uncharacterized protein n=1 Tax=Dreissena polymorpha TaxID=45954 RepID=A0A9D4GW26_DREPO|nr:hypothetical protein DPMN_122720 [Dreissena polymorpha]
MGNKVYISFFVIIMRVTSAGGSAYPAESVTLELDGFLTATLVVFSKMQQSCQPLFISQENRGGGLIEGAQDDVTQYAQRTGETVSGRKTTAGDNESGHKGRAVRCSPLAELRSDMNLS